MTTILYQMFDFTDFRLADRTRIHAFMVALVDVDGIRFLKKAIVCDDVPGERYVPSEPDMLDRAWSNAVRAAPRYNGQYWMEFENQQRRTMAFGFDPRRPKRLHVTIDRDLLRGAHAAAAMQELLHVVDCIAEYLQPAYGFGLLNVDVHDVPAVGALPQALWDINWFGEALARELPASSVSAYIDRTVHHGRLIVPAEVPFVDWRSARPLAEQAATALGFSRIIHDT